MLRACGLRERSVGRTTLGKYLVAVRRIRGISIQAAAREMGLAGPHLGMIERGDVKRPRRKTLELIAKGYELDVTDLIALADQSAVDSDECDSIFLRLPANEIEIIRRFVALLSRSKRS
ncbi:MAG: helix-turn-helix transcriptional regulator [Candidatus Latescibacterota bacterium]|nr:helix-turn-helix transcriptional regulator [Candidatus Latescibacterota bacterium]